MLVLCVQVFSFVKKIKVIYFYYSLIFGQETSVFADVVKQHSASIALQMRRHALLMARRVYLAGCLPIQPYATLALIGIAVAAQRCMVEPIQ